MKTPKFLTAVALVAIFFVALAMSNASSLQDDQTIAVDKTTIRIPPSGLHGGVAAHI